MDLEAEETADAAPLFAEFDTRQWPAWLGERNARVKDGGSAVSRQARVRGYLGPAVILLFLIGPLQSALDADDLSGTGKALALADLVLYAAGFVLALRFGARASHRAKVAATGLLLLLGVGVPLTQQDMAQSVYLLYAIIVAGVLLPVRWSRRVGIGVAAALVAVSWIRDGSAEWTDALALVAVTFAVSALLMLNVTISRLRAANAVIAEFATTSERTRLARDLHDLLGHSLATITVKAGLIRRMIESDADGAATLAEARDVETLSRQAMSEVRAAVTGYHRISLDGELAGARDALRAAGIEADIPTTAGDLAPDLREAFAWVLREGVTNVIKHSGATHCRITVGPTHLEIHDDGRGAPGTPTSGNGLRGLADRLRPVHAVLTTPPTPTGFTLRAEAS